MGLRLTHSWNPGEFLRAMAGVRRPIAIAATGAIKDAAAQIKREGRANIASAGFSARWQNALRVNVYPEHRLSLEPAAFAFHKIPYAGVFERGAQISGNPLLWIPLSGMPLRIGGQHLTPKSFNEQIGPLHSVNVPGRAPLLAAYMPAGSRIGRVTVSRLRRGAALSRLKIQQRRGDLLAGAAVVSVPIFFGISAVNIRKRFDLTGVFRAAQEGLPAGYKRNLRKS